MREPFSHLGTPVLTMMVITIAKILKHNENNAVTPEHITNGNRRVIIDRNKTVPKFCSDCSEMSLSRCNNTVTFIVTRHIEERPSVSSLCRNITTLILGVRGLLRR